MTIIINTRGEKRTPVLPEYTQSTGSTLSPFEWFPYLQVRVNILFLFYFPTYMLGIFHTLSSILLRFTYDKEEKDILKIVTVDNKKEIKKVIIH
jgi:hypothetical protein